MQPLPLPLRGGSIEALAPLLNLTSDNDFVLVVAWLLGALRAGGPYPVLAVAGEQRALIDPSVVPMRALPRDERELFIAASNGRVLAFNNLSGLPHPRAPSKPLRDAGSAARRKSSVGSQPMRTFANRREYRNLMIREDRPRRLGCQRCRSCRYRG
jgi:hypothetical protein